MFCLRSWIPILFFLKNASPAYLILFISATYFLNRPCVYCSLLLAILLISLFDFHASWFEPPSVSEHFSNITNTSFSLQNGTWGNATILASTVSNVTGAIANAAIDGFKQRVLAEPQISASNFEWFRNLFMKKEWRIPCVDVLVRL